MRFTFVGHTIVGMGSRPLSLRKRGTKLRLYEPGGKNTHKMREMGEKERAEKEETTEVMNLEDTVQWSRYTQTREYRKPTDKFSLR